jgi:hypothetical protein
LLSALCHTVFGHAMLGLGHQRLVFVTVMLVGQCFFVEDGV